MDILKRYTYYNSYIYNLNIIDNHSYIFFNSLKSPVRILLGRKYKLSILKKKLMFINSRLFGFFTQ